MPAHSVKLCLKDEKLHIIRAKNDYNLSNIYRVTITEENDEEKYLHMQKLERI